MDAEASGDLDAAAERYRAALVQEPANAEARAALSRVQLQLRAGGDEKELRARVTKDPGDIDSIVALADLLAARGDFEAAAELLIEAVRDSTGDDRERARTHLLSLLDALPSDDPRATRARRALARVLF
jgi:putative thioredoxin